MDKPNQLLRWSGAISAALLGVSGLLLAGCNGGNNTADNTTPAPTTTTPSVPLKPGEPMAGAPAAGPGAAPAQIGQRPGPGGLGGTSSDPFAPGGRRPANATAANARPGAAPGKPGAQVAAATGPRYNRDPFYIPWKQPPPPPDPFMEVQPLRVADTGYVEPPAKPVQVREVPDRRVAGIMSGDGVFAILEENGQSEVVKPGSVTTDGYRVVSITGDSVKLEKRQGNLILTQTVPLTDAQTGTQTASFTGAGPGAMSGYPGMMGGGRPGMMGGRPGGMGKGGGAGGAD